jgi:UDP-N-acetylglucosamine 2-epimerase (non-hydrolysing)
MAEMQNYCHHKILCVVGARPNMMKIAPVLRAFRRAGGFAPTLVHTGQHYDYAMSEGILAELGIPRPDAFLGVGSSGHAEQTARIMLAFDSAVASINPDIVLVVGDVNSTLAAALVAAKRGIPVAHIEAGLRSFDRTMPEEINRILTDQISDILFATEEDALQNLAREGIASTRVHLVGNVMIDSLLAELPQARSAGEGFMRSLSATWRSWAAAEGHAFLTLHRPSNIDEPETCRRLLMTVAQVADKIPVIFAVHPRTRRAIEAHNLGSLLEHPRLQASGPLPYRETIGITSSARLVLTDSGGLQEETTGLGIPCLTLREKTERPVTVREGSNLVVGTDPAHILLAVEEVLRTGGKKGCVPRLWDGRAADRIVEMLAMWFAELPKPGKPS